MQGAVKGVWCRVFGMLRVYGAGCLGCRKQGAGCLRCSGRRVQGAWDVGCRVQGAWDVQGVGCRVLGM